MTFKPEITLGDLAAAAAFLVAAAGFFLALKQLRIDSTRKRAEFIVSVFNQYVTDADTARVFYLLEYDRFPRSREFLGTTNERHLDRLLGYFEKIATLYQMGVIARADLDLVEYDFVRVFRNPVVEDYFVYLDKLPRKLGVSGGTFQRFRKVAQLLASKKPFPSN